MMTKCRRRGKFAVLAGPIELLSVVRDLAQPLIRGKAPSQIRDAQQCARKVGQNRGRPNTICPVQNCPKFLAAVIPIRKFSAPPIRDPWVLGSHISRSQENRGANYIGRICGRYPDMSASSSESRSCCSLLASLFPKAFVSKLHFRGHREQARPIQMID